jgi:hypothetical protein
MHVAHTARLCKCSRHSAAPSALAADMLYCAASAPPALTTCCSTDASNNCPWFYQYIHPGDSFCQSCKDLDPNAFRTQARDNCVCTSGYVPIPGTSSRDRTLRCRQCEAGTRSSAGDTTCTPCPGNSFSYGGTSQCLTCPRGTAVNADKTDCECVTGSWSSCTKSGSGWRTVCTCSNSTTSGEPVCYVLLLCRSNTSNTFNQPEDVSSINTREPEAPHNRSVVEHCAFCPRQPPDAHSAYCSHLLLSTVGAVCFSLLARCHQVSVCITAVGSSSQHLSCGQSSKPNTSVIVRRTLLRLQAEGCKVTISKLLMSCQIPPPNHWACQTW